MVLFVPTDVVVYFNNKQNNLYILNQILLKNETFLDIPIKFNIIKEL